MASSYTTLLGLELPVQGELSGTWGDRVNAGITNLLDTAIAGTTTWSTDANITLSTTTGAANEARQAIILCSGARTAERTITAPAASKTYVIINATTGGQSVKIVGVGPTTGVVIPTLSTAVVAWNGSDFAVTGAIVSNGKLFRATQSLTLAGTDSTTMTFPTTSATIARTDAANTFTGTQTVGALVATTLNGNTFTTGTYTLTGVAAKTLTFNNSLTLAGTDGTTMTFPSTSATIARTDAANTFTGIQTMTSPAITTPAFSGTSTGTWTIGGTVTLGAATWSGTQSAGGNQLNNVVIGTTTPLAGTFTTLSTSGLTGTLTVTGASIPQNSQSAAYTTVAADANKHILHPSADTTARTFTIDSNANVAYAIGTAITFVNQASAGVMTIAITTDTMRLAGAGTTGSRTLAANGIATALKLTATEWIISGTGLT